MDFASLAFTLLANQPSSGSTGGAGTTMWMVVLLLFFVVYIFFISRRDKKQKNEEQQMRDSLGDEVLTIGGIMGRVVSVKEDSVVIETGADRNKIRFTKSAIATNLSADQRVQKVKEEQAAAKQAEKEKKKAEKAKK